MLNILLQILDDGEVTDAHGRKVNFENTVIVMTSNAGSGKAAGAVGFGRSADDQDKERVMKALQEFLRPEFINRVDEIVYFHQLTEENFRGIAGIMLEELKAALEEKGYHFTYDDALVDYLVKKSYSAAYGARNPAAVHPEGCGGPHGGPHHRELRDAHHADQSNGGGWGCGALHAVMKEGAYHAVSQEDRAPVQLLRQRRACQ